MRRLIVLENIFLTMRALPYALLAFQSTRPLHPPMNSPDDFVFPTPTSLPADVRGVLSQNAVPYNAAYREASFEKLKGALILS